MGTNSQKKQVPLPHGTQTLGDLQQIRALAHPLRLRILGVLVREPHTTKQVADLLGENHTKLYHHVQELERAKVIRLTETRPKRGTIEKYYQATARLFQAAPSVFSSPAAKGAKPSDIEVILDTLLSSARADVLAHVAKGGKLKPASKKGFLAARLIIKGPRNKALAVVRRQIARSMKAFAEQESKALARNSSARKEARPAYALTIILCRIDGK
jgi:DNA-binding transcriptional ArsR family regulator